MQRKNRDEVNRYLTIVILSAPAALIVWLSFHAVYSNLSTTEQAIGYVDSTTQTGIYLGYVAMIGGTLVFAGIALWALVKLLIALRRR